MADGLSVAGEEGEDQRSPVAGDASTGHSVPPPAASAPPPSRRWVTAALLLVMVLASMEATVTSTAMPTIVGALKGLEHYAWVISIYLLASTITMPVYGRLSDLLGRKRVIMFSIALFAISSMLASMSQTMGQLILFRGLQGLGAGGIMPVVLTIVGDIFTLKERAAMQAIFSAVWGTAALAGPALGAFLVTTASMTHFFPAFITPILGWRSIFWVNMPSAAIAMLVLALKYHDHPNNPDSQNSAAETRTAEPGWHERMDFRGMMLLGLASAALLVGVSLLAGVSVPLWVPVGALVLGVAAAVAFIHWEKKARHPVMPAELMMHRAIGPSVIVSGLLGMGIFSVDTYVPLYVQGGRGWTAGAAAAAVTPVLLAWALSGLAVMPLILRWGFRRLVTAGSVVIALGFAALIAAAVTASPLWLLTAILFLTGAGFSPVSMGTLLAAQDAVDWEQRGIVTSSVTFFRNFGGALGVGLFGALFNILSAKPLQAAVGSGFSSGDLLDPQKLKQIHATHPEILVHAQAVISHSLYWVFAAMLVGALVMIALSRLISSKKHHGKVRAEELMEALG